MSLGYDRGKKTFPKLGYVTEGKKSGKFETTDCSIFLRDQEKEKGK